MRLTQLDPWFLRVTRFDEGRARECRTDATFADCDGLEFLCPLCFLANGGEIGTHRVICWKPHVPPETTPGPGRWSQTGSGFHDLSLVAGSSSIHLQGGCGWHGYVQNGEVHTDLGPERVAEVRARFPPRPQHQETLEVKPPNNTGAVVSDRDVDTQRDPNATPVQLGTPTAADRQPAAFAMTVPPGHSRTNILKFIGGILHQLYVLEQVGLPAIEHWQELEGAKQAAQPVSDEDIQARIDAKVAEALDRALGGRAAPTDAIPPSLQQTGKGKPAPGI